MEETLPAGFTYAGSSLGDTSVTLDGRTVSFVLLGDRSFTYTVEVPDTEGRYTFTGVFRDSDREDQAVGGASQVRVGPQPTATPIPTPTPTTEPTATPSPTPAPTTTPTTEPTATPPSTPTPTPEPTATPTPEPAATATPPPTPVPTDVPAPTQAATQEPSAGPTPETATATEGSGGLGVLGTAVAGVLLLGGRLSCRLPRRQKEGRVEPEAFRPAAPPRHTTTKSMRRPGSPCSKRLNNRPGRCKTTLGKSQRSTATSCASLSIDGNA